MSRLMDMTGERYGRLTVVRRTNQTGEARWLCRCDCGREFAVLGSSLRNGSTMGCRVCRPARKFVRI